MPGLFVAAVPSGAHVITTTEPSPEPPVVPGTTPHPVRSDTQAARVPAVRAVALTGPVLRGSLGRWVLRVGMRRLPVMIPHDSVTQLTQE